MENQSKWCTGYLETKSRREHDIEGNDKLLISLHSYYDTPRHHGFQFFLEKGVDIFLCTVKDAHLGFINVNHFGIHGKEYGTRNMG